MPRTLIETFRIKAVEPIRMTTLASGRCGMRITRQSRYLRHFTAWFESA